MAVRALAPLTLDAVRAESIALDLRMVRGQSPFDPTLSEGLRLCTLNDQLSIVFKEAFASNETDPVTLSKNLITLAAHALAWAQVLDNSGWSAPGGVSAYLSEV